MKTLDMIESIPTEKDDKPYTNIEVLDSQVFVNPFRDIIQEILKKENKKQEKIDKKVNVDEDKKWFIRKRVNTEKEAVGKYLKIKKPALETTRKSNQ